MKKLETIKTAILRIVGDELFYQFCNDRHLLLKNRLLKNYNKVTYVPETFKVDEFKTKVLSFVSNMNMDGFDYRFSGDVINPTLYSSVYACLIKGLFDAFEDEEKKGWCDFFDSFQRDDGLFYDYNAYNHIYDNGDGWGARHLVPHVIIAYERLGRTPRKPFNFLKKYYDIGYIDEWLENADFSKVWGVSNKIMNIVIAMQYARDRMNENNDEYISYIQDWLIKKIRKDYPLWFDGNMKTLVNKYEAIRGAYHIYPILLNDGIEIPGYEKIVDFILDIQNEWGGFDYSIWSSACDDIDAIDPLLRSVRTVGIKDKNVDLCMRRTFNLVIHNQNDDGGFPFSRYKKQFKYGGCDNLLSLPQNSNMFGTWFRVLSVMEMLDYFDIEKFNGVNVPGYEMNIQ